MGRDPDEVFSRTWDELAAAREPESLRFTPREALARIASHGDLMAPLR